MEAVREIGPAVEAQIRALVYDFFASECGVTKDELADDVDIIETLQGDSLMLLALLEMVRTRYGLSVELKALGRHLMRKPARTIGQVIELTLALVRHGDGILDVEL